MQTEFHDEDRSYQAMRNDITAQFEILNTMTENNKPKAVLIHVWKDNTQFNNEELVLLLLQHLQCHHTPHY